MSGEDTLAARLVFDREVEPETLLEWTEQTATPKPAREVRLAGALLVRTGKEWLGLPAPIVESAMPVGPIHSVPYLSSRAFLGLINVDGELLPCVSLAVLAGADPDPAPARPRIITVTVAEGRFSLLTDEAEGTCGYDPDTATLPPDTVSNSPYRLVKHMAVLEGRTAGIMDETLLGRALLRSLRP